MKFLIAKFVQTCPLCQHFKRCRFGTQELLQPLPLPTRKWQSIAIDLVYDSMKHRAKAWPTTQVSLLLVHLLPTKKTCNEVDTAVLLLLNVFKYPRLTRIVVFDSDPKLTAQWWLEFCNALQIDHHFTIPFYPQYNCLSERTNQTI